MLKRECQVDGIEPSCLRHNINKNAEFCLVWRVSFTIVGHPWWLYVPRPPFWPLQPRAASKSILDLVIQYGCLLRGNWGWPTRIWPRIWPRQPPSASVSLRQPLNHLCNMGVYLVVFEGGKSDTDLIFDLASLRQPQPQLWPLLCSKCVFPSAMAVF